MSFLTTKFQEILSSGFGEVALTKCFSSIFHFGQIFKFKKGVTQKKKLNQNFLWICASTHYVLHNYKVSGNFVERFQRSWADKKNRTDGLTDWWTGQKRYTLRNIYTICIFKVHALGIKQTLCATPTLNNICRRSH